MSYLEETFGVPLSKQYKPKQPDLQVTPESLMAPQQPFGALNAIGVSQPQVNVGPSSNPPLWQPPVDTSNQYDYAPNSAYQSPTAIPSPALARLGVGTPVAPTPNLTEAYNTPGAFPAPAQLLDMPTRDQVKESKRLANMAGVGGLLGLLLGGGAGALQGASSAVQGGSQALDFAAQNEAQKVQVENQKRLQEAANERQSWMDTLAVEDRAEQRKQSQLLTELKQMQERNDAKKAEMDDATKRRASLLTERNKLSEIMLKDFDSEGNPILNANGEPVSLARARAWNQRVSSEGFNDLQITEDEISATPTARVSKDIAAVSTALARAESLIEDTSYKSDIRNTRIAIEQGKLKGQELDNKLLEISVKYAPRDKESLIAWRSAMRSLVDPRIQLIQAQVDKTTAEANVAKNKAEGVGPVVLDPIIRKQIESVASSMDTNGWNKTVAAINAKYKDRIGNWNFGPDTQMGQAQAKAKAERDKEIEQAKTDLIQKAEKLGFTNVKFTGGSFTYDLPPTKRKAEVPTESSYLGKKPEGFGAFNPAWKPSENEEYVKLSEGKSNIIKETTPVNNSNPLGWRTTTYGYVGDNFNGDENSKNGIGNNKNVLRPGDVAVSPDVLEQIRKMKPEWANGKQRIPLILMRGGKFYRANFRIADVTAKSVNGKPLTGRVDIFTPAGTKDQAKRYNDMVVVTIGKDNIQQLKVEEVKAPTKTPPKKPLAKPAERKVESVKPVGKMSSASLEAERKRLSSPTNIFGNMQ